MKNEKMNRVAALTLAGAIMASALSPAAFAEKGEDESGSLPADPLKMDEPQQENKAAPAAVESAVEAKPSEELKEQLPDEIIDNVDPVVINPTVTVETEEEEFQQPVTSDSGELVVNPGSDVILTPVEPGEEQQVDHDGVLGVYDMDGILEDEFEAAQDMENPPTQEDLDQAKEQTPDLVIGDYPDEMRPQVQGEGGEKIPEDVGQIGIFPGEITGSETTEKDEFDQKDQETGEAIAGEVEGTIQGQIDKEETTLGDGDTVNVTHKDPETGEETTYTYTVSNKSEVAESTSVNEKGEAVTTKEYTLDLSCGALDEKEKKPLTAQEMAEILGVELDGDSVVTTENDTLISFKDADGNTYTVEKNLGTATDNQFTSTTWTVKVTEETTTHEGEAGIEEKVEITKDPEKVGETQITDSEGNPTAGDIVTENPVLELNKEQIEAVLSGQGEGWVYDAETGCYTRTDGSVSYTISTQSSGVITTDGMTNQEIAALMGGEAAGYTVNAEGKIEYNGQEITLVTDEVGQTLAVTITRTDVHGAKDEVEAEIDGETITGVEDIRTEDGNLKQEQQAAALEALKEQLGGQLEIGEVTWTVDPEDATKWTATAADGKTYTVTVAGVSDSNLEEKLPEVSPDDPQQVTVTGGAFVESGTITWTKDDYEQFGSDVTEDNKNYYNNNLSGLFGTDGKPQFDGGGEVTGDWTGKTFNGESVSSVSVEGDTYTITTALGDGSTRTYTFAYETVDPEVGKELVEESGVQGDDKGAGEVTVTGASLTTLTWKVETTAADTVKEENVTEEVLGDNKNLSTGASITENANETFTYNGTTLTQKEDGYYYAPDGTCYIVEKTEQEMTLEDIQLMLANKGIEAENLALNGNGTATYTDAAGETVTMTYENQQKITVTERTTKIESQQGIGDKEETAATKGQVVKSVVTTLDQVYKEGNKIEEFEKFLDEKAAIDPTFNRDDWSSLDEDGKNALYKEFADANVTSTPADYTELEGQELIDYLKKTINTDNWAGETRTEMEYHPGWPSWTEKHEYTHVGNHFDLAVNPDLVLEDDKKANCVILNDVTVRTGTLEDLVNNFDQNYEFKLQDKIGDQGQGYYEYTRASNWKGEYDNYDHTFTKDNSYYRMTGTVAYVSEENADNPLFTSTYQGSRWTTAEQAAKQAAQQAGYDPNELTFVTYENENGSKFVRIYDSTAQLDTYGYLTENTNGCIYSNPKPWNDGYDLVVEEMALHGDKVTADYKGITTWSATLHVLSNEQSSKSLTVESLKKNVTVEGSTTTNSEGGRTAGEYNLLQNLKVSNQEDSYTQANQYTACYQAGAEDQIYTLSQDWLTTTDTYGAEANQYGVVTVGEDEQPAVLDYTYQTTEVSAETVSKTEDTLRFVYAELDKTPAPGGGGEEPGEGPEDPGEEPEDPGEQPEGPILILTDEPTEEDIADEETPLTDAPEDTVIEDEDTPLAADPADEAEILDEETPLSAVPKTGDESGIWLLMSAVSGLALAVLSFIDRKGRHARFGSQH